MESLKEKHYKELIKVKKNKKYTKSNNFWSPLAQADIIHIHRKKGNKQYRIDYIEITHMGEFLLNHIGET